MIIVYKLNFLRSAQALACLASVGQGALRLIHKKYQESVKNIPAPTKIKILYFEKTVIQGATEINPAKAAPIPKVTNKAGRAQHSNVPMLVNRLKTGNTVCLYKLFNTINPFNIIT